MPEPPEAAATVARLEAALAARAGLFDEEHLAALRLFNGFYEGCPDLAVDLYARTLVLHDYAGPPQSSGESIAAVSAFLRSRLPWLRAAVLKSRQAEAPQARAGVLLFGQEPDRRIREHGVEYAVDLRMNRDASFYIDTRELRAWALHNLAGQRVLNTFAYTGSLGVAALAGGAGRVVQMDRSRRFLDLARRSYALNGFPLHEGDFLVGDFWAHASRLRRSGALFDCVFLDPPFFSAGEQGTVDLERQAGRLINKLRPLVSDGGCLVAINNALYVSGADYLGVLERLCADGYMAVEALLPVPEDFTGYPLTRVTPPPVDPAPFNHPTKIAVLRVRRKDARR